VAGWCNTVVFPAVNGAYIIRRIRFVVAAFVAAAFVVAAFVAAAVIAATFVTAC